MRNKTNKLNAYPKKSMSMTLAYAVSLSGSIGRMAGRLVFFLILAASLAPKEMGEYALVLTSAALLAEFLDLGWDLTLTARQDAQKWLQSFFSIRSKLFVIIALLGLSTLFLPFRHHLFIGIGLLILSAMIFKMTSLTLLRCQQNFKGIAFLEAVSPAASILLLLYFQTQGNLRVEEALFSLLLMPLSIGLGGWILSAKLLPSPQGFRKMIQGESSWVFTASILNLLRYHSFLYLITAFFGLPAAGIYHIADRLATFLNPLVEAARTTLFPLSASQADDARAKGRKEGERLLLPIGIIASILIFLASSIYLIFFLPDYSPALFPLSILLTSVLFSLRSIPSRSFLYASQWAFWDALAAIGTLTLTLFTSLIIFAFFTQNTLIFLPALLASILLFFQRFLTLFLLQSGARTAEKWNQDGGFSPTLFQIPIHQGSSVLLADSPTLRHLKNLLDQSGLEITTAIEGQQPDNIQWDGFISDKSEKFPSPKNAQWNLQRFWNPMLRGPWTKKAFREWKKAIQPNEEAHHFFQLPFPGIDACLRVFEADEDITTAHLGMRTKRQKMLSCFFLRHRIFLPFVDIVFVKKEKESSPPIRLVRGFSFPYRSLFLFPEKQAYIEKTSGGKGLSVLKKEWNFLKKLPENFNLGPAPLAYEETKGIGRMKLEWISGSEMPNSEKKRWEGILAWCETYYQEMEGRNTSARKAFEEGLKDFFDTIPCSQKLHDKILELHILIPDKPIRLFPIHGDLCSENIQWENEKVRVLDWETAGYEAPAFTDLWSLIIEWSSIEKKEPSWKEILNPKRKPYDELPWDVFFVWSWMALAVNKARMLKEYYGYDQKKDRPVRKDQPLIALNKSGGIKVLENWAQGKSIKACL